MLHDPIVDVTHTVYCGPKAIAILTGVPVSRIEKMLRRCRSDKGRDSRGRKIPIRGTYSSQVVKVLRRLGCKVEEISHCEPTLGRFITDTNTFKAPCLVMTRNHFTVTFDGKCYDHYAGKPTVRVVRGWRVEAPATPKFTCGAPAPARKPKPARDLRAERHAKVMARIKRLETKIKRATTALKKAQRQARYYQRVSRSPDQSDRSQPRSDRNTPPSAAILSGTRIPSHESSVPA